MKLYNTTSGVVVEQDGSFYRINERSWDVLINRVQLSRTLRDEIGRAGRIDRFDPTSAGLLPPIGTQEVWAAGVTYFRSRDARMEESQTAGGGSFYDRVYSAERPELFFKSPPYRVVGPTSPVRIRRDAKWNVPEPELTLVINARGEIVGCTIGNDMSSRDIEGENPLYLPQAKVYDGSCAVGPCVLVTEEALSPETRIAITISRGGRSVFDGTTTLAAMKRTPKELVGYLYRETTFPTGALLMTGTGIIPPSEFTLNVGDVVNITIDPVGTLTNVVEQRA